MVGSDSQVVEQVASVVSVPREDPGDSFILHAPLETLARFALLQLVTPDDRGPVLDRIRDVGRQYDAWGPAYAHEPDRQVNRTTDHVSELVEAIETADSEMADNAISSMAATMGTPEMVAALAGPVLPATAAAAHGNILLYLLPRIAPRSDAAAAMARTTVHEVMRAPAHRLSWFQNMSDACPDPEQSLVERLIGLTSGHQSMAISVAATYVLGFRACLSTNAIDPSFVPDTNATPDLLHADPATAAAIAWHTPADEVSNLWCRLASHAGAHRDAHLAKYTLACIDATRDDPDAAPLFRGAAAYLNAWWARADD